jgi:hypothetical protein
VRATPAHVEQRQVRAVGRPGVLLLSQLCMHSLRSCLPGSSPRACACDSALPLLTLAVLLTAFFFALASFVPSLLPGTSAASAT